jgi:hypothetical protein
VTDHPPRTEPAPAGALGPHADEPHDEGINGRLNALRAAVLGANDGIVSVAGIVMGVAGATSVTHTIFVAGLAGLVAGALSMAAGEYVSVSTQRDTERALLAKEAQELLDGPDDGLAELAGRMVVVFAAEADAEHRTWRRAVHRHHGVEVRCRNGQRVSAHGAWLRCGSRAGARSAGREQEGREPLHLAPRVRPVPMGRSGGIEIGRRPEMAASRKARAAACSLSGLEDHASRYAPIVGDCMMT